MNSFDLSQDDKLRKRLNEFPGFVEEIWPSIEELALYFDIKSNDSKKWPDALVLALDKILIQMNFDALDHDFRVWLHTRLMYLVGEALISRHGGYWFLQSDPESDFYLKYVVGGFNESTISLSIIDPAEVINQFLHKPVGRSLTEEISALHQD